MQNANPTPSLPPIRSAATATIEPALVTPSGSRGHLLRLVLEVSTAGGKHSDKIHAATVAKEVLGRFVTTRGAIDRTFAELFAKPNGPVTGIEGCVALPSRPDEAAVAQLREALREQGYAVSVREARECSGPGCMTVVATEWDNPSSIPMGWHSSTMCGKHQLKTCVACDSLYVMSSSNASGQAPSVKCDVCGAVMVEWGGTKIWHAELVSRTPRD